MKFKIAYSIIGATVCAIASALYIDDAIKAIREQTEWSEVIREDMAAQANGERVPESTDVSTAE